MMLKEQPDTERGEDVISEAWLAAVCSLAERQLEVTALCCLPCEHMRVLQCGPAYILCEPVTARRAQALIKQRRTLILSEQCIYVCRESVSDFCGRCVCILDAAAVHRTACMKAQADHDR